MSVAKLVQVIALDLMIFQHLCSKNFNYFLKMKGMWAELAKGAAAFALAYKPEM